MFNFSSISLIVSQSDCLYTNTLHIAVQAGSIEIGSCHYMTVTSAPSFGHGSPSIKRI